MQTEELLKTINSERRTADLGLARRIAQRIRNPSYSLRNFHDDVSGPVEAGATALATEGVLPMC